MLKAVSDVMTERGRQDAKWGEQNHNPIEWVAVLTEEVGEVSQEALRIYFGEDGERIAAFREEMVQVAAVAVAAIECIDRGLCRWSRS